MTIAEIAEIFVCVLAVWGLYCILHSVVSFFADRSKISLGVYFDTEQSTYDFYCSLRSATLITERKNAFKGPPVALTDELLSDTELKELSDLGTDVYLNYKLYRNID
ncbi:MAG: hypothetical protein E7587_03385 [Ruminococcaceae bacterium]|nr:hypothetical protein [Oscillospiraceae bacterium]